VHLHRKQLADFEEREIRTTIPASVSEEG